MADQRDFETLGAAFPKAQARARAVLQQYHQLGAAGAFGAALIEAMLQRADKAAVEHDVVAMIRLYQELQALE